MRPAARNTLIVGLLFLLGTPIIGTILALIQKPDDAHGGAANDIGQTITKILVANFACLPFMALGIILVLVAIVMQRRSAGQV